MRLWAAPGTGLEPASTDESRSRAGSTRLRGPTAALVGGGGWDFVFYPLLRGRWCEGSEVSVFSGEKAGRRPWLPAQVQALSRSRTAGASGGTAFRELRSWQSASPGSDHSQSSGPSCSAAETPATNDEISTLISFPGTWTRRALRRPGEEWSGEGRSPARPPPAPAAMCWLLLLPVIDRRAHSRRVSSEPK